MNNESRVLLGLMSRGVPPHIAQGMVANMIAESRLDPGINEIAPLVPGSRGGFGLNQWTGPRRRALEAEAQARGVPVSDLDFQLDYTLEELRGPEGRAMNALMGASSAEEAARIYSEQFLRPGIPHLENRLAHARRLSGMDLPAAPEVDRGVPQGTPEQQNALAPRMQFQNLDPAAFQARPQNALAAPEFRPRYLTRNA
jgi:hypothetical protein